jgi:kynureninase
VIRAAPVPLYNRFADVLRLVDALDEIARTQPWTP